MPYNANDNELEILEFWNKNKIFEKSIEERPEDKPYVFYDGPPFATGLPHYGHIVASLEKDVVPRYQTMRGFRVERKWGWDCHGLPVENIIEKELELGSRTEIEEYGIDKFNKACSAIVMKYAHEWKKTIPRMGRWVDMENDYKTMDIGFMESVWWVFKQLWEKGLIYEGYKAMHICPRCVTPLSNFEVTQNYQDVKDISVIAKFGVRGSRQQGGQAEFGEKFGVKEPVYLLAWTTTPWTLPGNVLLAVGAKMEYSLVEFENAYYLVAKERLMEVFKEKEFKLIQQMKGKDLVGLEYEPLFPYFANTENGFRVVAADFVDTNEGTGIVHIAPAFGEDDYQLGLKEKTGWVQHVTMEGKFIDEVTDFAGMEVKPKNDPSATDVEVLKWLAKNDKLFSKQKVEHSYPHCWRCDTPLLNYATSSWFVKTTEIRDDMLKNNEKINWVPEHIKHGRFGKWLEGVRDWAISRNRFWGSPLPIWKSEDGDIICVGSVSELEELSGKKVTDLHKHIVDDIVIEKDGKKYTRIPEVLDCWFESGSMPYAQVHYPFENKEKFEKSFPADFIAEAQEQSRGWFYTLHVLSTALTRGKEPSIPVKQTTAAFKNVIGHGIVLAEDGKKMSKRLKNYPAPDLIFEKYGADAMRYYLVSSPVLMGENLNFLEEGVREVYNKVVNTLWNVFTFYQMFADQGTGNREQGTDNVLDKWILAKLQVLVKEVTEGMEAYKLNEASRPILDFITDLSQWYVRRSRDRFKKQRTVNNDQGTDEELENDFQQALGTLRYVLLELSKVMAPFTPFIAEKIWQAVNSEQKTMNSVHLEEWPEVNESLVDEKILKDMEVVRKVVEMGHALRKETKIAVRQPLQEFRVLGSEFGEKLKKLIADELNVQNVVDVQNVENDKNLAVKEDGNLKVALNTEITPELKKEGLVREIVRAVNEMRKEQGLTRHDRIVVKWNTEDELLQSVFTDFEEELKKSVLADGFEQDKVSNKIKIEDVEIGLEVKKF